MRVLVSAASRHGSTDEIARMIAAELSQRGLPVTVLMPDDVAAVDDFDAIVLGSALYAGHWLDPAVRLADRWGAAARDRPAWLFSSGPVGDPSRPMVRRMGADPRELPQVRAVTNAREHRVFAGRLDRRRLGGFQRFSLRFVRGLDGDFRDWAAIRGWARSISEQLGARELR
jgi:menaquinone-dependent protoporphyrinogen oxidase